jgi:hypothetical protein
MRSAPRQSASATGGKLRTALYLSCEPEMNPAHSADKLFPYLIPPPAPCMSDANVGEFVRTTPKKINANSAS